MRISDWSSDVCSSGLMNQSETSQEERAPSRVVITVRTAEIIVAIMIGLFASLPLWSNYQLGAGWSAYGPEARSEESRVGNECVRTCRSRSSPYNQSIEL